MSEAETIIEHHIRPGENIRDVIKDMEKEGGFSELRVGDLVVWKAAETERRCGHCTMCCTAPGINKLKKPPGKPCIHLNLNKRKCSIYQTRPDVCRKFQCGWLIGNFDAGDRPDKIGAIVVIYEDQGAFLASILVNSKHANTARISQIFQKLGTLFPRVQMVVDDERIGVMADGKLRQGKLLPRPPGDYESTIYALEE